MKKLKSFIFGIIVIITAIIVFLKFSELKKIISLLTQANYLFILAALASQAFVYLFIAKTYKTISDSFSNVIINIKTFYKAAIIMLFLNQTIPSMGISGNTYFFSVLKKRGEKPGKGIFLVVFNMVVLYSSYLTAVSLAIIYLLARGNLTPLQLAAAIIMGAATIILLLLLTFLAKSANRIRKLLKFISVFFPMGTFNSDEIASELFAGKEQMAKERKVLFKAVFFRIISFAFESATIYMIFLAFGLTPNFAAIAVAYLMANLFAIITFMPGGLGVFETTMILTLRGFHIPLEAALIATLIYRAFCFWLPIPLGLWLYRKSGKENEVEIVSTKPIIETEIKKLKN